MNMKWRKVIGDLLVNPGRIILVIFALIIGLWGVGSILVSYTILSRDLNKNFVRTNPLHAAITSKDFYRLDLTVLRSRPEIERAEYRDFATLRIETHPDDWIPLWLFGVEDFNNSSLARIFDQKGNSGPTAPEDGALLIERDGLRFSDLKALSPARVRAGGRVVDVPVAGISFDPAQAPGTQDTGVGIVALPYNSDLFAFRSIKGRWLSGSTEPEIVMNQEAAVMYDSPAIGSYQTLSVRGKRLKAMLVGIVEEFEKPKIYMDKEQYDAFANPNHYINSLMFVAKDKSFDKLIALKKDIEKAIEPTNLQVLYVMMQAERVKIIYDHLKIVFVTIVFFALLVLVVSAIGMASATGINIMERTREIGVLRAIGATPKIIYHLFVAEGMIVSVISIFLGLLLSWPLSIVASKFFGNLMLKVALRFSFSKIGFVITIIATLIFGWMASRIPARRAIKVSAREALAYEWGGADFVAGDNGGQTWKNGLINQIKMLL